MKREERFFAWAGGITAAFLILHLFLQDYEWWFQWAKESQTVTRGSVLSLLVIGICILGATSMGHLRSKSNVLLTGTMRFIFNPAKDRVHPAGDFWVMPFGGINAAGVSIEGREGTLVMPRDALRPFGPNALCLADAKPTTLNELPRAVRDAFNRWDLPTTSIYIALAPAFVEAYRQGYAQDALRAALKHAHDAAETRTSVTTLRALEHRNRILARQAGRADRPKILGALQGWLPGKSPAEPDEDSENRIT